MVQLALLSVNIHRVNASQFGREVVQVIDVST